MNCAWAETANTAISKIEQINFLDIIVLLKKE